MGPPKRRPKKISYSEVKERWNYFEYRWDANANNFYLYNPHTGETILSTNVAVIDRSQSMWAPIEKYPSDKVQTIQLLPEWYLSRRWGRRKFKPFTSQEEAAIHITAVARGFLARLHLRRYFRNRYTKQFDSYSGYYYFVDSLASLGDDTSWYKPRLAFPEDIREPVVEDPDDYLKGYRYSKADYQVGPFIKVQGLSKYDTGKAELTAFLIPNATRDAAFQKYEDIDLSNVNINDMIDWMDGSKLASIQFNEYHFMRTAICNNNWKQLIYYMKTYSDNVLIQLFGYYGFSKGFVPMDSPELIDFEAREALDMCVEVVKDLQNKYDTKLKVYAMKALHNLFSVRATRVEYLNTDRVTVKGPGRDEAVEQFLTSKLNIFNRYLTNIPTETVSVFVRNEKEPRKEQHPLFSALDIIGASLQCLCLLAEEQEPKETLAVVILDPLIFAMQVCHEDAFIVLHGLKLMYNLCYRSEPGQQAIYLCCNPKNLLFSISYNHSGDIDVMRQVRRLELTLEPNGWRGNVEAQITKEFYKGMQDEDNSISYDSKGGEGKDDRSLSTNSRSHSYRDHK
eukprot:gene632-675_t